jgi:S1-C subfamily serine protease
VPGHALAVDQETGLGLVQTLESIDLPAMEIGRSSDANPGDPVIVAAGGHKQFMRAQIVDKHEFAGYWEYFLDEAIFTAPAHPFWGGAALIGAEGKLLGIGSLHIEQTTGQAARRDVNMIVPIDLLAQNIEDLLKYGRVDRPARPWLGVYSAETEGKVVIAGVAEGGPAAEAGLRRGDLIVAVGESRVVTLSDFYHMIWRLGPAGVDIPLEINRDGRIVRVLIQSIDRNAALRKPRLH